MEELLSFKYRHSMCLSLNNPEENKLRENVQTNFTIELSINRLTWGLRSGHIRMHFLHKTSTPCMHEKYFLNKRKSS